MTKQIIKIKNMTFKYDQEYLFKDFNLEIEENSFVAIIGKNGSGKSSLAKILAGLIKCDGYINIDGYLLNDLYLKKVRRILSVCLDDADEHFLGATVMDDLAFSLENLGYASSDIEVLIKETSKKFKIDNILERTSEELNNSEKEKVAIASSLIHNPKILLLDEAIHKLNASDKKLVFKILKEKVKNKNLTVIMITHDLEDTLNSDRIILLNNGKIVLDDTKEKVYVDDKIEKWGFNLPFIVKLSHNLMLYDLLDRVYLNEKEVIDKLWGSN